jgi:hypothetical protein
MSSLRKHERDQARWVRVEHEHFIPLTPAFLHSTLRKQILATRSEKDAKRFATIMQLLEMLIKIQYHPLSETLKTSYDVFDPNTLSTGVELTTDEIQQKEGMERSWCRQ